VATIAHSDLQGREITGNATFEWVSEFWHYRELLYFLAWREVKLRYKQAALGAAWAIIQPLFSMIIFTLFFGRLAGVPSDGIPYPLFSFCALVPWTYFSGTLTLAGNSLACSHGNQRNAGLRYRFRISRPHDDLLSRAAGMAPGLCAVVLAQHDAAGARH
jgi:hypothetical protein